MLLFIPKEIYRENIIPDQIVHQILHTIAPLTPNWIEQDTDSLNKVDQLSPKFPIASYSR